jgi:hypothetical protein
MRVLFYKRVCCTDTCVNTVRTLPLNRYIGQERYHAEIMATSGLVVVVSLRRIGAQGAQNET